MRLRARRRQRDPAFLVVVAEVALYEAAAPGTVVLTFRAPGDDGDVGAAARYELVRADAPIDAGSWDAAEPFPVDLEPGPAGAPQGLVFENLEPRRHDFALRAVDEAGNVGPVGANAVVDVR